MNQTYSNSCQWSILEQVFFWMLRTTNVLLPFLEENSLKNWIHFHFCFVYLLLSIGQLTCSGPGVLPLCRGQWHSWLRTQVAGRHLRVEGSQLALQGIKTANHQLPPSTVNFPMETLGTHTICPLWNNWKPYLWNWWYSVDNLGVWMGGKQNVKMKPALVKNLFNISRVVQDSLIITKEKAFVLLLPTKWVF